MKIGFITGSRSEWGYIRPILRQIEQDPDLGYALIVTNMHLLPGFGSSIREIEQDGFRIAERIFMAYDGFTGLTMTKSLAALLSELPAALERASPDVLLLAGDRGEQFMGAIAAVHMRIPVAHVQSGELSGNVDGIIRHAITKLAHLHFAANEEFAQRVRSLGEEEFRIHVTGAPLVDELTEGMFDSPAHLAECLGLATNRPLILAVQHPVIEEEQAAGQQLEETIAAVLDLGMQTIFISPNSDAGSHAIRQRLAQLKNGRIRVVQNLRRSQYLGLLKMAAVIVGNSSSGILEAPTFGTPCVNIGRRQRGRLQSGHVINSDYCRHAIASAIRQALSPAFAAQARRATNPYGNGGAAQRIVKLLKDTDLTDRLLNKELTF
jgi:GDP/UDP-N,N'-diacetylbacillosamine 2-epimerase (hydrolysing)